MSISMDGRGRYLDNIFIERLWRSVKQEKLYRYDFETIEDIELALSEYFEYYNNRR
ncbi:integrase core domain-containing protein, partial [Legionella pneumophila]